METKTGKLWGRQNWFVTTSMASLRANLCNAIKEGLTNLVAFFDGITGMVDGCHYSTWNCAKYLTLSYTTPLLFKLKRCRIYRWATQWIRNWLNSHTQKSAVSSQWANGDQWLVVSLRSHFRADTLEYLCCCHGQWDWGHLQQVQ